MPFRRITFAATLLVGAISAYAPAAAQNDSHNPAVKSSNAVTTTASAEGANSFTQAQARKRLMKGGYSHVSKLAKDGAGVWRGTAMKDGAKVNVGLDYKGNISAN
jgi:hypothetical protein